VLTLFWRARKAEKLFRGLNLTPPHTTPSRRNYTQRSTYNQVPILPRSNPSSEDKNPKMPAIRHASKRKAPPAGFSDIEDDLLIFSNKMKDAENASTVNVPRHKVHWPIFQISHQRSRYVYELYYEKEAISKELYDWLLKNGYADAMLIAKWKKTGYEKVCFPQV
jgi:hypothetical protein